MHVLARLLEALSATTKSAIQIVGTPNSAGIASVRFPRAEERDGSREGTPGVFDSPRPRMGEEWPPRLTLEQFTVPIPVRAADATPPGTPLIMEATAFLTRWNASRSYERFLAGLRDLACRPVRPWLECLAMLSLLLGHHLKAHELSDTEGGRHRDIGCVAAMTRIHRVPTPSEKDLEPGAEIHRIDVDRNADVAEIAGAVAGGNVHAAAKRDGKMGEVAAHADAFVHGIAGATSWARVGMTKADLRMNEIADRLNTQGAGQLSELRPGEIGELVAIAIAAREQEQQYFVGKVGDRRRPHVGGRFVRLARVLNDEAIGERHEPRRDFDARDPVAEKIEIRTHGQRGIRGDPVRGQQVGVPGTPRAARASRLLRSFSVAGGFHSPWRTRSIRGGVTL